MTIPVAGPALRRAAQLRDVLGIPLSTEQIDAATAPLEPGVIVAGAGSGKTTVMAARVVWLVGSGQLAADEVLGLTFTNKAAAELAARIRAALGKLGKLGGSLPAEAGEPTVSTYHAFAGRLVQEHGLRIGVEPRARLLADATRYQLAARVVRAAAGPFEALTVGVPTVAARLIALDAELSEHLVSTDALRAHDAALLEQAALVKPTGAVRRLVTAARARTELSTLVDAYRAAKRDREVVDFGDQVLLAATLAERCPEVGAAARAAHRVVLLDEYQDTSVAQRRMLVGLFGCGHAVTAVGDPCQSIYGWRGASVANLDEFSRHFRRADGAPARRHTLVENRRSGSRLLDLANAMAALLRRRHAVEPLRACEAKVGSGDTVCALLPTYAEEMSWAAGQVRDAVDSGVPPGEIAVLVRARSDFAALHAALLGRGLPVEVVGLGGLLALPEVADIVATLEVLDDPTSNAAMVRLLTGPRWRIGPRDLVLLGRRARALVHGVPADGPGGAPGDGAPDDPATSSEAARAGDVDAEVDKLLEEAVAGVDPTEVVALADAVDAPGRHVPYSAEARERLALLAAELRSLRRHTGEPLLDLLARIVATTGLDVELAASPEAVAAGRRDAVASFLDQAAAFVDLDGDASVSAFLAYLRAADEFERGLDTTAPTQSDAVKLMTAHKAKGLEWQVVVLPAMSASVFPSARGRDKWTTSGHVVPYPLRGDYTDNLPRLPELSTAGFAEFDEAARLDNALEERRLGYVAVTRAQTRLIASGHHWGPTQKRPRGPSVFLEEIRDHCRARHGTVAVWAPPPADGETNPALAAAAEPTPWPAPLDPAALARRRETAAAVRAAAQQVRADPGWRPGISDLASRDRETVRGWDRDAQALLEELRRDRAAVRAVPLPAVLSATQLLRLAADPGGLARSLARPMPRRPEPAARRGTRFHAWVEAQFAQQPLLGPDDLPGAADADISDEQDLRGLQEAFLRSPYAGRSPHAIEAPFQLVLGRQVVRGRIDAVYADAGGAGQLFEVVDWKTNRDETADPLQLAIYRLAWAELAGVPVQSVGAAFLYVRSGRVVRPADLPDRAALEQMLSAPAAGPAAAGGW